MNKATTLIVGGTSAIGIALAERLLGRGEDTIIHGYVGLKKTEPLQDKFPQHCSVIKANLSDELEVIRLATTISNQAKALRRIVFCAAPIPRPQRIKDLSWSDMQLSIDVQVKSTFLIMQKLLPNLLDQPWARIVFMTSAYTLDNTPGFLYPYISAKYMLNGLMLSLSSECRNRNIRINGIAPIMVDTPFIQFVPEIVKEQERSESPQNRLLTVDDVLPQILDLLDETRCKKNGTITPIKGK